MTPYFGKLLIGNNSSANVRRVTVTGIQFDECEIKALTGRDVENVVIDRCQFNNYRQAGREGIRFTGAGDIENLLFSFCGVRVQISSSWFISFEARSDANGHIKFDRCLFDNINGFTDVDSIVYRPGSGTYGHTGTGLVFDSCSFVFLANPMSGQTPDRCYIVRLKGGGQDAGPRQLVLSDCHFELQKAPSTLVVIDDNPLGTSYCSLFIENPCITVGSGLAYKWIDNANTGGFIFGSCLMIASGRQSPTAAASWGFGATRQSANFKMVITDFVGFNPQGAATIALPGVGPFTYTNDDGVYESLYIRGSVTSIVKNGITLFTSTPATVHLGPRESVIFNYPGPQVPTVVKDLK